VYDRGLDFDQSVDNTTAAAAAEQASKRCSSSSSAANAVKPWRASVTSTVASAVACSCVNEVVQYTASLTFVCGSSSWGQLEGRSASVQTFQCIAVVVQAV
jgi:hypothetical protein